MRGFLGPLDRYILGDFLRTFAATALGFPLLVVIERGIMACWLAGRTSQYMLIINAPMAPAACSEIMRMCSRSLGSEGNHGGR